MAERIEYDEFAYFHENAEEYGIAYDGPPTVRRESVNLGDGRRLSALVWGDQPPELVLIHGGAQNAHTWDTVALALDRPLIAIDLPGHGHSDAARTEPADQLAAEHHATDLAAALTTLVGAGRSVPIVGMSLGGLTSIALTAVAPDLVGKLVLIDVTPGVTGGKAKQIIDFVKGPATFDSFDQLLERTIEFNPTRTVSSLRRGILHNAMQLDDGTWMWRYRRHGTLEPDEMRNSGSGLDVSRLWDVLGAVTVPVMLVRGMREQSVVADEDEAELVRRLPGARIEHVAEAGHSVQGDTPVELATLLDSFI